MKTEIAAIKQELERRFSLCYHETKDRQGNTDLHFNFPRVYDYISYVGNNPVLSELMLEESERRDDYVTWMVEKERGFLPPDEDSPPEDIDIHLNQCSNYSTLVTYVYEPIDALKYGDDDPLGLAYTLSPWQIITHKTSLKNKFDMIRFRIQRGSSKFQKDIKEALCGVHYRLMNLLAEYETRTEDEDLEEEENGVNEPSSEPSEAVLELSIAPDSKWEDITIKFKDEYLVTISYQGKELEVRHEDMGFSDKRNPDRFRAKDSWLLLILLSASNGIFKLTGLTRKEKAKRQKQKQELTKLLKKYFQITDDPFYETDKDNPEYRIKLKLIPDPTFRDQYEDKRHQIFDSKNVPRSAYLMNFQDTDDEIS